MQADLKWLDDPQTFRVNQLPAHSDHQWYLDYAEADQQSSSFTQSLDVSGALPLPRIRKIALRNFMHRTMMSANGI